jgi:hypothetical protein
MSEIDTKNVLNVIEILKGLKGLLADTNPYLPVYSAIGGAFIGAISTFIPAIFIENLKARRDRKSLTFAIYAEISATLKLIEFRQYIEHIHVVIQRLKQGIIPNATYQIIVPDDYCLVYKSNISKIGTLDSNIQIQLVQFYQLLEGVIQDVKPGGILNATPQGLEQFESVLKVSEQMIHLGSELMKKIEKQYNIGS